MNTDFTEHPQISVKNFSYFCTEDSLLTLFNSFLPVKGVRITENYTWGGDSFPDFAVVTLTCKDHESAVLKKFHGKIFMGRILMYVSTYIVGI
jgi:RNA recognition motif-containing protein